MDIYDVLKVFGGLAWSFVYIILIINGFKYKRYGMPFVALALNISWEFIYSFHDFDIGNMSVQRGINFFWLVLDIILLYQYLLYGKKDFHNRVSPRLFIPWFILVLTVCFFVEYAFLVEFIGIWGAKYSAFLQNLLMSFLFISFLLNRDKIVDISMSVAVAKWLGTLAQTIVFGYDNQFIFIIGLLCGIIDLCYIGLLHLLKVKELKIQTSIK